MTAETIIHIYPKSWADLNIERAGKKYCPSNGTEGLVFTDAWCGTCERDKVFNGDQLHIEHCAPDELCQIVALTMMYGNSDDPNYPKEWVYGKDGQPRCTAYVPKGQPIPPVDDKTIDMFGGVDGLEVAP